MEHKKTGTLYIVATSIGHLADMTFRAVETLQSVAVIACEDTRVTAKLCAHYEIDTERVALHQHSNTRTIDGLVARLVDGEDVAYVSDAGTPGVSDPGNQLVAAAVAAGVVVSPVPGASALGALVSVAGTDLQQFHFLAFPPHKKGRQTFFAQVAESEVPVVYFESVHRVVKNLTLLAELAPEKHVVVGRELTKMFEEVVRGTAQEVVAYFTEQPDKVKGEFVIAVV